MFQIQWWISLIFGLLWISIHFLYHIVTYTVEEVGWHLRYIFSHALTLILTSLTSSDPSQDELANIFIKSRTLKKENKLPKHLGVVLSPRGPLHPLNALWINLKRVLFRTRIEDGEISQKIPRIDFEALAKVVCCAWIADIPVLSLYDYHGYIKSNHKELLHHVQIQISHNLGIVGERTKVLPRVKLHNVPVLQKPKNGYTNGYTNGNGISPSPDHPEVLNICLFSYEDGKDTIITTCKDLYKELPHSKEDKHVLCQSINEIDEKVVDKKINAAICPQLQDRKDVDPDLMIVLGKVPTTVGFPLWKVRLTEIHWLPCLSRFDGNYFLQSLLKYAKCDRRFGT